MSNIRKITESDRQRVMEMMRDFYSSDATWLLPSDEIFNNDITECISDSPFADGFVFTDEEGTVRGYAMIAHSFATEFGRRCIWIEDLYLEKELQGTGLASEFLAYIQSAYPEAVHRLESEDDNEHANGIYRRKGFRRMPYIEMIRNLPDEMSE